MSNSRKICVCGRERGKEPVVITITTCRHKHPPTSGDPLVVSSPPQATSSLTRVKTTPDEPNQSTQPVENQDEGESKNNSYMDHNGIFNESPRANHETDKIRNYETASESVAEDNTQYKTNGSFQETEAINNIGEIKETSDFIENQANGALDSEAHDTTSENKSNDIIKNPTVMMVTETAMNTLPFLENLFWPNTLVKSMPNLANDCAKKLNCAMELLIIKKHSNDCRNNTNGFKSNNTFFDGDSFFENFGRISLPICTGDVKVDASKSETFKCQLKGDCTAGSETSVTHHENLLGAIETYLRNKQFLDDLSKNTEPCNRQFRKYIATDGGAESGTFSKGNIKDLYLGGVTTDRAIQLESVYVSNEKTTKWYEWFLICFGLKNSEEICDGGNVNDELIPRRESSSYIVTKYLKI